MLCSEYWKVFAYFFLVVFVVVVVKCSYLPIVQTLLLSIFFPIFEKYICCLSFSIFICTRYRTENHSTDTPKIFTTNLIRMLCCTMKRNDKDSGMFYYLNRNTVHIEFEGVFVCVWMLICIFSKLWQNYILSSQMISKLWNIFCCLNICHVQIFS